MHSNNYRTLAFADRRVLGFGILLTAMGGLGNTFFIGLFGEQLRGAFDLSHGGLGSLYTSASIVSGLCLMWLGKHIDRIDLVAYTFLGLCGFVVGAFLMLLATSVLALAVALFTVRLFGPALMTHTALTSMSRYFDEHRGKAVGIALLGQPISEALLPPLAVGAIAIIGWRYSWALIGGFVAFVCMPIVWYLLRGHEQRHQRLQRTIRANQNREVMRSWSRRDVLRTRSFYLALPALSCSYLIITGLFFHQAHIADMKGWSMNLIASCFVAFASAKVLAIIATGILVDRVGARSLLPFFLLPLGASLLVLSMASRPEYAVLYFVGIGLSAGAGITLANAVWAEIYGVRSLGTIRSLAQSVTFAASALAPVVMGVLFDLRVSVESLAIVCLVLALAASALSLLLLAEEHEGWSKPY